MSEQTTSSALEDDQTRLVATWVTVRDGAGRPHLKMRWSVQADAAQLDTRTVPVGALHAAA